jgi:hypothetical protein
MFNPEKFKTKFTSIIYNNSVFNQVQTPYFCDVLLELKVTDNMPFHLLIYKFANPLIC